MNVITTVPLVSLAITLEDADAKIISPPRSVILAKKDFTISPLAKVHNHPHIDEKYKFKRLRSLSFCQIFQIVTVIHLVSLLVLLGAVPYHLVSCVSANHAYKEEFVTSVVLSIGI